MQAVEGQCPDGEGWIAVEDGGFVGLIGPVWQREAKTGLELALVTSDKHKNRSGVVQGGAICTLADRALGTALRLASGQAVVTIKLDVTFMEKVEIGSIITAKPTVAKISGTLAFGCVEIFNSGHLAATAEGVFKLIRHRSPFIGYAESAS
jgi:uncharacterized protein (TIGR00369 family)